MFKVSFFGLFLFALSFSSHAEVENWYTYWSLGGASNTYPSPINQSVNELERLGYDRTALSLEMLGFYIPTTDTDLLGFVISATSDALESAGRGKWQITTYLYALSYMKFMGPEAGSGFYLRGDIGASRGVQTIETSGVSYAGESDWGVGALGGIGYGFALTEETRLLLGLNYVVKHIEDKAYTSTMFTIGGLW